MNGKMNCWEYNKCGREENGTHVSDMGVCPCTKEVRLNGVHNGRNAGRACWVVSGTFCKGVVQGTFAQKFKSCTTCNFYNYVKDEEHPRFVLSATLLQKLQSV